MAEIESTVAVVSLTKTYPVREGLLELRKTSRLVAMEKVSLNFPKGKTTAIVGESGSGKTTLGECTLLLNRPDSGSILYNGLDLAKLNGKKLNRARSGMQMVFQDPYSSLNPRMKVRDILVESVIDSESSMRLNQSVVEAISSVGLSADALEHYPHEFSAGQRQRIAIARALISRPSFMVLDEPTSALDVSIQLQILNLFRDLQRKFGMAYMFITHNLAVAKYTSHFTAVMFNGRIVEWGPTRTVVEKPRHPYTIALLSSIPSIHRTPKPAFREKMDEPVPVNSGCRYRLRCPFATDKCLREPELLEAVDGMHLVRCHYHDQISANMQRLE